MNEEIMNEFVGSFFVKVPRYISSSVSLSLLQKSAVPVVCLLLLLLLLSSSSSLLAS